MSRQWEPKKSTVEMRPSRIRREPVSSDKPLTLVTLAARSHEWEIGIAIVGVILFAIGINALWLGINAFILD
jgi:hypothetical protein